MGRPYAAEMERLGETVEWAATTDIGPISQALRAAAFTPLRAIGSGGSLTVAHALAAMHRRRTGQVGTVATPLAVCAERLRAKVANWLISAGGTNVDILAATRDLISQEPHQVAVLCGRPRSPLGRLCTDHPFVDLLAYPPPAGKDGFLATNSLLGFVLLLERAHATESGDGSGWRDTAAEIRDLVARDSSCVAEWLGLTSALWDRPTTVVLYGPSTEVGAVDLESKFTEAALGHVQIADFRNFAHGRHHWLAKWGHESSVLALVAGEDRRLAERTLALLPSSIPQARLEIPGSPGSAAIASLVAALRVTGQAGSARGIDPGRPRVPDFGRKLYSLRAGRRSRRSSNRGLSGRAAIAIARKAGSPIDELERRGELASWVDALAAFNERLRSAPIDAVVLDYDGTIVDTRMRFAPPTEVMSRALVRVVESGPSLAIATGRGASVGRDLRERIPHALWDQVLVGYYNGAEIATLGEDSAPDGRVFTCEELAPVAAALRSHPELSSVAEQSDRQFQITIEGTRALPESRLWELVRQCLLAVDAADLTVTCSSHSVDVLASGVSKSNVLAHLWRTIGAARVLTIGDRGRWPGNDYQLLGHELSLSVDEVSPDPLTCWNLGEPGQRGPETTLSYLTSLAPHDGSLVLPPEALR